MALRGRGTAGGQATREAGHLYRRQGRLHGLTIYLATYWARSGVRVNTITLGGVESGQPAEFLTKATSRIPMGRMASPTDFQGALVYLCSDAAAFVTGANVVVDGGKTVW